MYTTFYSVLVNDNIVASGLRSRSEAEQVKFSWLDVFPDVDVKIYGHFVPLKGGVPIV